MDILKKNLLTSLEVVLTNYEKGTYCSSIGICGACIKVWRSLDLDGRPHNAMKYVKKITKKWEHYSGDDTFPISVSNDEPEIQYYDSDNKWEGEYGLRRVELLKFIISELKKPEEVADDRY